MASHTSAPSRSRCRFRRPAPAALLALATLALPPGAAAQTLDADALDGLRFRTIGPATMSGRLVDVAVVESSPEVFYVAAATGGVWKTVNNGVTWTPVFEDEATHSVGDVVVHQTDTSVVWVGTGERASRQSSSWGDGVYKSTDGGETWTNMGLEDSKHIGRIVLHPDDPNTVFVAAMGHLWGPNQERGLYRSADGGETWERVLNVDEDTGVVDVAMDPEDPSILYAASYQRRRRPYGFHGGGPGSALWKSTDGGDTWTKLTNAGLDNGLPTGDIGRIGISIYRSDPRIVYASIEQGERYNASTAYEQREAGIYRSEDRGETWEHMSDWNPRPMYASQPMVDPNDDQRIYMMNEWSWSDDAGRSFETPDQSLHGDDRFVWVNPENSNHLMKLDDGGLGISYDRGVNWLYVTNLPLSQYYRVSTDTRDPYHVYGGLQDNGSWAGPNATYREEGILNEDWTKWGGGDGFRNVVDTTDNRLLYVESQYLGLDRVDLETGERQSIRPGDPTGAIGPRRNWTTWPDPDAEPQRLGNAMEPANWDGPFILSPHDPSTVYAGTRRLWKSTDQGRSWEELGDLTTGVARQTLEIMGQQPDSFTLSLDDGIPYYPTLSEIAESPLVPGLLYVGTDDGNVQVSEDDGRTWREVGDAVPGLPEHAWINGIEPSRFEADRVYLAVNDYRNDDYANYLWRSDDRGETWVDITGDLPAERVVRTIREDLRNPDVLYLGTELGLFYTNDGGERWVELGGALPTMAFNDLTLQPRENDLVVATHNRGIWILDQVNALQELTPEVIASGSHLFSIEPARQIRYREEKAHAGDMVFAGENPPAGAILDYWLAEEGGEASVTVHDAAGQEVAWIPASAERGMNRVIWNLRHSLPDQEEDEGPDGPFVVPGTYAVRLTVDGAVHEREVTVSEDPRVDVPVAERRDWTELQLTLGEERRRLDGPSERADSLVEALDEGELELDADLESRLRNAARELDELRSRYGSLISEISDWVGPMTADQRSEREYYAEMLPVVLAAWEEVEGELP